MAGISPKGVVVYHIFSENPKVSQTFDSCSSIFSFQKEIGKTGINQSSSLLWVILEHTEIRMELISEGKEWDQEAMSRTTMEAKCRRNWIKLGNKQMMKLHPDSKGINLNSSPGWWYLYLRNLTSCSVTKIRISKCLAVYGSRNFIVSVIA